MPELDLSVLSIGYTRGLWSQERTDEIERLCRYAAGLVKYTVLVNSRASHGLGELRLADNFLAIPSGGRNVFHNAVLLFRRAQKELAAHGYQLIQAQDPAFLGPIAMLLGKLNRVPVNVCVYGPNPFDVHWRRATVLNRGLAVLGAWVVRHSAGVQVDGALTERSMIAHGVPAERVFRKAMVPVDVDDFFAIERPFAPDHGVRPVNLLFVGRLTEQKNLPMLFEALSGLLGTTKREFRVQILGRGPLESKLKRLARRRGLSQVLEFTGHLPRKETLDHVRRADIFVLPSVYEGMPRVFVEAAAAGLPIVTTEVSGSDELVVHGRTGFVVPIDDPAAFRERVRELIDDPVARLEMGRQSRAHARVRVANAAKPDEQLRIWQTLCARAVSAG